MGYKILLSRKLPLKRRPNPECIAHRRQNHFDVVAVMVLSSDKEAPNVRSNMEVTGLQY